MREIVPTVGMSVEQFLSIANQTARDLAEKIRSQKSSGERRLPSSVLIDKSNLLTKPQRSALVDKVAELVDQSVLGRSDMCFQSTNLMARALAHLGVPARSVVGRATYYSDGHEIFRWPHAWVRVGKEVIDANTDCIHEHPPAPLGIKAPPYWGPVRDVPAERLLRPHDGSGLPADGDVEEIWWPELRDWLGHGFLYVGE